MINNARHPAKTTGIEAIHLFYYIIIFQAFRVHTNTIYAITYNDETIRRMNGNEGKNKLKIEVCMTRRKHDSTQYASLSYFIAEKEEKRNWLYSIYYHLKQSTCVSPAAHMWKGNNVYFIDLERRGSENWEDDVQISDCIEEEHRTRIMSSIQK